MSKIVKSDTYKNLIRKITDKVNSAKIECLKFIGSVQIYTYWEVGRYIVEYEQEGNVKAEYGKFLITELSKDLSELHGKGYSRSNVYNIRQLYIKYPQKEKLTDKLTWSHYVELLSISDEITRNFYEVQCVTEKWSIEEFKRQKKSALFERLALSKDKEGVLKLSKEGQIIEQPTDIIKNPYILEFVEIPEKYQYDETELEKRLIDNLQRFLLELGKGFAFVGRQYRITLNNTHFHVDLVFYHIKLKCYVLIDLKKRKLEHYDIGQMNMYLGYFANEQNNSDDNEPIGIILSSDRDEILVEYATYKMSSNLFVSKYELYLPNKKELEQRVKQIIDETIEL